MKTKLLVSALLLTTAVVVYAYPGALRLAQQPQPAATPVNAIAERLGYSEPSTFHRAFKKWTGRTPGQYRSVHRAEQSEQ